MTVIDLLGKMALTIKQTIDQADITEAAMVGHLEWPIEQCILPKQLRRDLGECLDDLKNLDTERLS